MIEMTQAEVDEAEKLARLVDYDRDRPFGALQDTAMLARAVRHLAERDRQNTAVIELGVLAELDAEERCAVKLAEAHTEIARLAARQMPALRWEEDPPAHADCYLGGILVGGVFRWGGEFLGVIGKRSDQRELGRWPTESEARAAVEAAVRKELGVGA